MPTRMLMLFCVCQSIFCVAGAFDASAKPENARELLTQYSELIVIAKQVGPIQHHKIDDVAIKDVYEGEFVVQKFIKGEIEGERLRVHAGWLATTQTFPPADSTTVLYLNPHFHGLGLGLRAFELLPDKKAEEQFAADYSNIQKAAERRRQEALDELSAIAPESLKRAKELWPDLLARSKELNENKRTTGSKTIY